MTIQKEKDVNHLICVMHLFQIIYCGIFYIKENLLRVEKIKTTMFQ